MIFPHTVPAEIPDEGLSRARVEAGRCASGSSIRGPAHNSVSVRRHDDPLRSHHRCNPGCRDGHATAVPARGAARGGARERDAHGGVGRGLRDGGGGPPVDRDNGGYGRRAEHIAHVRGIPHRTLRLAWGEWPESVRIAAFLAEVAAAVPCASVLVDHGHRPRVSRSLPRPRAVTRRPWAATRRRNSRKNSPHTPRRAARRCCIFARAPARMRNWAAQKYRLPRRRAV